MNKKDITSVGLDLSLTGTGLVILTNGIITKKVLIKSKKNGDLPINELKRIKQIIDEIVDETIDYDIDIAVIEGLAFMARNSTALVQLSALNYMVRDMLTQMGIPFVIVAPTSLKKFITGKGNVKKDIILMEIHKRYGITIFDDNEADAYGLAQIGLALKGGNSKKTNKKQEEVLSLLKKQVE